MKIKITEFGCYRSINTGVVVLKCADIYQEYITIGTTHVMISRINLGKNSIISQTCFFYMPNMKKQQITSRSSCSLSHYCV